ncbi:uncharacterized protein [Elaeis guineensis]|uniref:uncharacterized protein n=1 Tax=Elaeis guineensis var. tenera TaxID=51953 RepID=UPI003C6D330E
MVDGSSSTLNAAHDPTSPYFISPSENPENAFVTSLLKGPNYPAWRRAIITALRAKRKIRFVDGTLARSIDGSRDHFLWDTCNSMVMSWIYNSVVPKIYDSISFFESARDIWVDLEERYSQGNAPRIHELKIQIWSFRQGNDMTIAAYYAHLRGLWEELTTYSKVPTLSKLARELNCAVLFFLTFCALQDLTTRKLIGLGELRDVYAISSATTLRRRLPYFVIFKRVSRLDRMSHDKALYYRFLCFLGRCSDFLTC